MNKNRLEAFSDAVIAIIITIMVLELKQPSSHSLSALQPLIPIFFSYILSFIYIGIYWNNHHHMLSATNSINGKILWFNLHLLFWLSLIPFTTTWMGESHFASIPTLAYGFVLFMASAAYSLLQQSIISEQGRNATLGASIGKDWKGKLSLVLYFIALVIALKIPFVSLIIYVLVALIWIVPDKRIEAKLGA